MGLLYIHLGYSKAANTSISNNVLINFNNFKQLSAGHMERNINKDAIDLIIGKIVKNNKHDNFFNFSQWSSFDLFYSNYFVENLVKRNKDVKFSLCVRNQMDWLQSYYLHEISCKKIPRRSNFDEFVKTKLTSGYGNLICQLNYFTKIQILRKYIPKRNLKVLIFEKIKNKQTNVTQEISSFLKRSIVENIAVKKELENRMDINEKITGKLMVRLNTIGYIRQKYGIFPNTRLSNFFFMKSLKKFEIFNKSYQPNYSKVTRSLIKNCFRLENEKLSDMLKENLFKLGY